jgi:hypothetical protein
MEPVFAIPYSEFAVAEELCRYLKKEQGFSAYLPMSRQQKGVDFLIHLQTTNKYARFQVKASRSYEGFKNDPHQYNLWFNNFIEKYAEGLCDFYCLFGLYSNYAISRRITGKKDIWHPLILCLSDCEMKAFLQSVKTKKEPRKPDRFFGIGFDEPSKVFATRGFDPNKNISDLLLGSKVNDIRKFLS